MKDVHTQTKHDVQAILAAAGTRPHKRFGQNFLIDGNLMRKLVASADLGPNDLVLEVGGGTGGLTDLLAAAARAVIVVEIDRVLANLLRERFAAKPHVRILHTDILSSKHTIAPEVHDVLGASLSNVGRGMLVANLPYNAATPLMMNLLTAEPRMVRFCFTIQKEVADRITAAECTKDYGPLSIAMQTTCAIERVARIPPQSFWPAPQVESAMLRLDRQPHAFEGGEALSRFLGLLHAAFAHRRKTLRYNLSRFLTENACRRAAETIDLTQRAEAIAVARWIEVGKTLCR